MGAISGRDVGNTPIQAITKTAICNVADMKAAICILAHYFLLVFVSGNFASNETLRKPAALSSPITPITVP